MKKSLAMALVISMLLALCPASVISADDYGTGSIDPYNSASTYDAQTYDIIFDSQESNELLTTLRNMFLRGDITNDKKITAKDSLLLRRHLSGIEACASLETADANGDGTIDLLDSLTLRCVIAGLIDSQKAGDITGIESVFDSDEGAALLTVTDAQKDMRAFLDFNDEGLTAEDYSFAVLCYKPLSGNSDLALETVLYPCSGTFTEPDDSAKKSFNINKTGGYSIKLIDLRNDSWWSGSVSGLGIDIFTSAEAGDAMYIDSIALCPAAADAENFATEREMIRNGVGEGVPDGFDASDRHVIRFDSAATVSKYITDSNTTSYQYDSTEKALKVTVGSARVDPWVYIDLSSDGLSADEYKYMIYVFMLPTTNTIASPQSELFFCAGNISSPTAGCSQLFPTSNEGVYRSHIADHSETGYWKGSIHGARLDYFADAAVGDAAYISSVIFTRTEEAAKFFASSYVLAATYKSESSDHPATAADTWSRYKTLCYDDQGGSVYMLTENNEKTLYFSAGTPDRLNAEGIESRLSDNITSSLGVSVGVSILDGFDEIKSEYTADEIGSAPMTFKIVKDDKCYVAYIPTTVKVKNIILDTDLGSDCDDGGAVAMLIKAHRDGECRALAITSCVYNNYAAYCMTIMCEYFGVYDIEIGVNRDRAWLTEDNWYDCSKTPAEKYFAGRAYPTYESNVALLRRLMSQHDDITFSSVGPLTTVYALMLSGADANSPLSGRDLFVQKVSRYILGGGNFPNGTSNNNLNCDTVASEAVINNYLKDYPIIFSGGEVAGRIQSGGILLNSRYNNYILRDIYRIVAGSSCQRWSWDLAVTHYAVYGGNDYWDVVGNMGAVAYGDGCLTVSRGGPFSYMVRIGGYSDIADTFNQAMVP